MMMENEKWMLEDREKNGRRREECRIEEVKNGEGI